MQIGRNLKEATVVKATNIFSSCKCVLYMVDSNLTSLSV